MQMDYPCDTNEINGYGSAGRIEIHSVPAFLKLASFGHNY